MTFMEIALLVVGVIIFVISFMLPEKSEPKSEKDLAAEKEEVHRLIEQEIDGMKIKVNEVTNDTVDNAVDRAERSLERVSNEKIMAVNEYAGTVIEEINKNHKEVMFLYDMIKDKQTDLTNVVRKADATVKEIENISHTAQAASETLLRGMSVATVSQKGLTKEQKAVFDDIVPENIPVSSQVFMDNHVREEQIKESYVNRGYENREYVQKDYAKQNYIRQEQASLVNEKIVAAKEDSSEEKSVIKSTKTSSKGKKGAALTQSKIFADLAIMEEAQRANEDNIVANELPFDDSSRNSFSNNNSSVSETSFNDVSSNDVSAIAVSSKVDSFDSTSFNEGSLNAGSINNGSSNAGLLNGTRDDNTSFDNVSAGRGGKYEPYGNGYDEFGNGSEAYVNQHEEHVGRQKVAMDVLSGTTFREGHFVNVEAPAGRAVTAADFAAMVNGAAHRTSHINSEAKGNSNSVMTQAPANNNDRIIEMSKQGMSTVDIAKSLGLGVGEVKLVIDLFR